MSELSDEQVKAAITFNRRRHYSKNLWKQVQAHVEVATDGDPGPQTARHVARLQAQLGLTVDGKVGNATLAAFGIDHVDTSTDHVDTSADHANFSAQPARSGLVHRFPGDSAFFYCGKLAVDADGAPNAYHPENKGIDALGNAGKPGNWWGLATDECGEPFIQGPHDPYPGYFISATSLCDSRYPRNDPRRYIDATKIPYFVLGKNIKQLIDVPNLRKGDLGAVCLVREPTKIVFAMFADVGPRWDDGHVPGEGSVALAQALGHDPFVRGRVRSGISSGVFFVVFPGSGDRKPLSNEGIQTRGRRVFEDWGGHDRVQQAMAMAGVA